MSSDQVDSPIQASGLELARFILGLTLFVLFLRWAWMAGPALSLALGSYFGSGGSHQLSSSMAVSMAAPGLILAFCYGLRGRIAAILADNRMVAIPGASRGAIERLEVAAFRVVGLYLFAKGAAEFLGVNLFALYARRATDPDMVATLQAVQRGSEHRVLVAAASACVGLLILLMSPAIAAYLRGRPAPPAESVD